MCEVGPGEPLAGAIEGNGRSMATSTTRATAATSAAEMMKTVKAECDKAPAGPKKDAALKHCQAAEAALKAHNEQGCISALKQAQAALK